MAEEKKRFPWWLVGAALTLPCVLFVSFIETVGRQGTIVGRYEQIKVGMTQKELFDLMGPQTSLRHWRNEHTDIVVWADLKTRLVNRKEITLADPPFTWHVRRWAEQAYTAIHGPRR